MVHVGPEQSNGLICREQTEVQTEGMMESRVCFLLFVILFESTLKALYQKAFSLLLSVKQLEYLSDRHMALHLKK